MGKHRSSSIRGILHFPALLKQRLCQPAGGGSGVESRVNGAVCTAQYLLYISPPGRLMGGRAVVNARRLVRGAAQVGACFCADLRGMAAPPGSGRNRP